MKKLICTDLLKKYKEEAAVIGHNYFKLELSGDELLKLYASIFMSYEESRNRLRIIAVKKDKVEGKEKSKKKKQEKDVLFTAGKKTMHLQTLKKEAELFCKLLQQARNIESVIKEDRIIRELKEDLFEEEWKMTQAEEARISRLYYKSL